ncbi:MULTISPECIES: cbb3-type cytochrome oxidase subunit 3 [unclassified Capnocytophaga]|jgi:Cbb3-type cytochrome oxidase component FixQ.|uniref:cbb3-type cytochrome oxidase subunit 3 n=1 Tax=unclassified Capnocytophaga TaxID=2640652 RepID=UPI000202E05D|nr:MULTISPECIES: coproporphyrinogen III oxidase [unclassified Capnocytophaga]EGD34135.1 coproporphyrinogen III oxidase [Capnocytophaga sp. oral taxon 338 str. F0234]MEB3004819.1 CcoQ/FixQ family Cbb3-type cytochrome c oxidase assembly chaperone [Capnocytophaga sp. G2]
MMKFIKHHMETISGVSIYPIISLIICFTFFVLLFWWVLSYKKKDLNEISNLPLNDDEQNNNFL